MQLRDHPLMSYRGVRNWPPVWTLARDHSVKALMGEVGVLKYVHSNSLMSNKCFLVIDLEEKTYIGSLIFRTTLFAVKYQISCVSRLVAQLKRSATWTYRTFCEPVSFYRQAQCCACSQRAG